MKRSIFYFKTTMNPFFFFKYDKYVNYCFNLKINLRMNILGAQLTNLNHIQAKNIRIHCKKIVLYYFMDIYD